MPGDLHRLTLGLVLKLAKLALKLYGGCPNHNCPECIYPHNQYYTYYPKF